MITLRVILGFIAIIFSFKFLGVVDKAYHFNLLSRDIILVIWSALLFILALYVFGMIKLPEGYNLNKGIVNSMLGVSILLLSLTLLSGIFGNRLTYLAAYLPPQSPTYVDIKTFKRTPFFSDYLENDKFYDNIKFADILSSIETMFNPAFFKALIDVSRPLPRPLMTTSTFDIPISIAFKAAARAAV